MHGMKEYVDRNWKCKHIILQFYFHFSNILQNDQVIIGSVIKMWILLLLDGRVEPL